MIVDIITFCLMVFSFMAGLVAGQAIDYSIRRSCRRSDGAIRPHSTD